MSMDIIAAILSYLGSIIGIVASLLMLGSLFFASPRLPTSLPHATVATQADPMPHKIALSRPHKMATHKQLLSAGRADIPADSQTRGAGHVRYAIDRVPTTRWRKPPGPVSRDHVNTWAYRHERGEIWRRSNYAQELSGGSGATW